MLEEDVADEFERLITEGKMEWRPVEDDDLGRLGQMLMLMVKSTLGKILIGTTKVDGWYVLKFEDKYAQYVDVNDEQDILIWATDDHHRGLHPGDVSTYILKKTSDSKMIDDYADILWPDRANSKKNRAKRN